MGFKKFGISQWKRFKRHQSSPSASSSSASRPSSSASSLTNLPLADQTRMKWTTSDRSSFLSCNAATPFDSTSFFFQRQQSRLQREEKEEAPRGAFINREYTFNVGSVIVRTCCCTRPFTCNHQADCRGHQSQTSERSVVIGSETSVDFKDYEDVSSLHLQFQGLHVLDPGSDNMEVDDLPPPARDRDSGDSALKHHRRVRSFTDDNFDLFG